MVNWVWKELLVSSAARGQTTEVKAILKSMKDFGLTSEVLDLFPTEGSESCLALWCQKYSLTLTFFASLGSTSKEGWDLHNDHWTQAMKDAGRRLLEEHCGRA